ncbi:MULTISPECIES: phage tail tip fiber protein, partial [unclassified Serratia (in: enterobacteria)]|uniref:phage tail tip fiber protein n=1 Tax=unclassified Serratia (in: enterobacteria) TaxID=2647522 RepID=UPI0030762C96
DITAVEYDPNKYARIDTGARIEDRPISVIPPGVQAPPTNVRISENSATIQGLAVATLYVTWDRAENAIAYETEWRRDNGNWIPGPRVSTLGFEIQDIYAGRYQARVRAINSVEISSVWANAPEQQLYGKIGEPPALASFTAVGQVFGIVLNWAFPAGAEDTQRTEIWYSMQPDGTSAMHLGDYAYPQRSHTMTGLAAGVQFWFQARIVDRLGNAGPWTAWVKGSSSSEADEILDYLTGQITETQLGKDLLGPIEDASQLKNMWSIKVGQTWDGKLYSAGIGVGVENTPAGMQSQVLFMADRFAFLNVTNGVVSTPFAIDGGQTFINSAFIKNGSITNAKIGQSITSNDWVWNADPAKTQGWAIDKSGYAWFNNVYIRGTIHADNGYFRGDITGANGTFLGTVKANRIQGDLVDINNQVTNVNLSRWIDSGGYIDIHIAYIAPAEFNRRGFITGMLPGLMIYRSDDWQTKIYAKPGSVISALGLGGGLADVALLLNGAVIAQTDHLNDDPLGNGRGVSIPTTPFNISANVENYLTLRIKNVGREGNWITCQLQCAITLSRATPNIVFLV